MRCTTAQRKLTAYLGEELTERERDRLEDHLASCATCARTLRHAQQVQRALSEKTTPPLPPLFHARLMARAREHTAKRSWGERILKPFGWGTGVPAGLQGAAAAAVVVAFGIGVFIGRDIWHGDTAWEAWPGQVAEADPVETYRVDYLTGAPEGSVADAYVSLVSAGQGGE